MDFMINFSALIPDNSLFEKQELINIGIPKGIIKILHRLRLDDDKLIITNEVIKAFCPEITESQLKLIDFSVPYFEEEKQTIKKSFRSTQENVILKNIKYEGTGQSFSKFCNIFLKAINPNSTEDKRCLILLNTVLTGDALKHFHKIRTKKGFLSTDDALQSLSFKFGNFDKVYKLCSKYQWKDDGCIRPQQGNPENVTESKSISHQLQPNMEYCYQCQYQKVPNDDKLISKHEFPKEEESEHTTEHLFVHEPPVINSCKQTNDEQMFKRENQTHCKQSETEILTIGHHQTETLLHEETKQTEVYQMHTGKFSSEISKSKTSISTMTLGNEPNCTTQIISLKLPLGHKEAPTGQSYSTDSNDKKSCFPNDIHKCTNQSYLWDRGKIPLLIFLPNQ